MVTSICNAFPFPYADHDGLTISIQSEQKVIDGYATEKEMLKTLLPKSATPTLL